MKRHAWLMVLALLVAACGDGNATGTATAETAGGGELAGVSLEVHEAPG